FWQSVVRQLAASGILTVDHTAYGALVPEEAAREVLKGVRRVALRREAPAAARARDGGARQDGALAAATLPPAAQVVFQALRAERTRLAKEQGVPPYVVFHDTTLRALALARPRDLAELGGIPGIGRAKLERYGAAMLKAIAEAG